MSLRDDRGFEQAIHSSELQAENDRLRSQLEGCKERLRVAEWLLEQKRAEVNDWRTGDSHARNLANAAFDEALTAPREGRTDP